MNLLQRIAFHPFLFALFPTLALLAHNIEEVAIEVAERPLLYSLAATAGIWLISSMLWRSVVRGGLIASLVVMLFFTYGHGYHLIKTVPIVGQAIGHHRYLIPAYCLILALGIWWVRAKAANVPSLTVWLNLISLGLLIYPVFQIVRQVRAVSEADEVVSLLISQEEPLHVDRSKDLPDIYYIILDTYARADAIEGFFDFDNTPFLEALEELGFYVAGCSRCNYCYTKGSLISSLNMGYLPELTESLASVGSKEDIDILIKYNLVMGHLKSLDYTTIAFDSGFEWSRIRAADIYLSPESAPLFDQVVNPFEKMLLRNSAGLVFTDVQLKLFRSRRADLFDPIDELDFPFSQFAKRQLYILDTLPQVVSLPGPKWVFVHILPPHPPRVFTPEGDIVDDPGFYSGDHAGPISGKYEVEGYINEIQFINQRMLTILNTILRRSRTKPVIIIQGDSGGPGPTLTTILNAYYLRGEHQDRLYPTISPVNTFRLIFDTIFGSNYGLLPDETYLGGDEANPVPETWPACQ